MKVHPKARILGTGAYLPERRLTNADLEKIVDTSDEWITTRTGISERRVAADGEATSDLAFFASQQALDAAKLTAGDLDMIIVATISPDTIFPSTACLLQKRLGARTIPAFDLAAACSGFLYGLEIARHMIVAGSHRHILVVGGEVLTRFTDYEDRASCVLFGDGAGAVVVGPTNDANGILDTLMGADGRYEDLLQLPGGGSRVPPTHESVDARQHYMKIKGRAVYKLAVTYIVEVVRILLKQNGLDPNQVDLYIPHQMNTRIIEAAAERLGITMDRVFVNIDHCGNTSAASIPIALDEAVRTGRLRPGMHVVLVAFGGGLTWAATLLRW
ncbi:MAG: beta-ketoacyl-ACP synthase III [Planctomycetota bacterium]